MHPPQILNKKPVMQGSKMIESSLVMVVRVAILTVQSWKQQARRHPAPYSKGTVSGKQQSCGTVSTVALTESVSGCSCPLSKPQSETVPEINSFVG